MTKNLQLIKTTVIFILIFTITNFAYSQASAGADQQGCKATFTLDANKPPQGYGVWKVIDGSASFVNASLYNTDATVGFGTNTLRWSFPVSGTPTSDDVIITNNLPSKAIAGADQDICSNSTILSAERPTRGTGTWSVTPEGATFSDITCEAFTCNTLASNIQEGTNTFKWTVENNSCSSSDYVTVIFNEIEVDFSAAPITQTYPNATINIENLSNASYNYYLWDFGDGNTVLETSFSHPAPHTYDTWGEYEVTLTGGYTDCLETITKTATILEATSGIEELSKKGIKIIPNPSNGIFNIVFENNALPDAIAITNMSGQKVYYNAKLNKTESIDISKSGFGVYIISIKKGNQIIKSKIIVNK